MISAALIFSRLEAFGRECQQLDLESPLSWPAWLRALTCWVVFFGLGGLLWLVWLAPLALERQQADLRQSQLRGEFRDKLARAAGLPALLERQQALQQRLQGLESQLLAAQDLQALLSDLNRLGDQRQLMVELFRPAELQRLQPYGQQRITLRVTGRFTDLLDFAADVSELPWLLSIASFTLVPTKDDALSMDILLRTLRQPELPAFSSLTKASP